MTLALDGRGPYDADVVVIGGGPAGLTAATRVRWVKGYHAVAGSVMIVESGTPGGLLRWGSCVLSGPGWAMSGEALADQLLTDVRRFRIPLISDRVVAIERLGPLLLTRLASGRTLRSLAVVIATGLRPLANETEYYLRGVRITFKGYEHFPALLRHASEDASGRGLVVVGNEKSHHLDALLAAHTGGAGPVTVLYDGQLLEVLGQTRVEAVRVRRGAVEAVIPCGAILMEYNGFELKPDFGIGGVALVRDGRGFLQADGFLRTNEPGVFAAGDICGRYAATLPALGDGVTAGLSAYAFTFEAKFSCAPTLFAYAPRDEALPESPVDLPPLADDLVPVALGRDGTPDPPEWVDGTRTVADCAALLGVTAAEVTARLAFAVDTRALTFHRLPKGATE